jgi:hypothetical protein
MAVRIDPVWPHHQYGRHASQYPTVVRWETWGKPGDSPRVSSPESASRWRRSRVAYLSVATRRFRAHRKPLRLLSLQRVP